MNNRIHVIINGKRDFSQVAKNLKAILSSDDMILIYTFESYEKVLKILSEVLEKDEGYFEENSVYAKFNAYKRLNISIDTIKKFTIFAMPNNLFHKIPNAYNAALDFVNDTNVAKYVHIYADDVKCVNEDKLDFAKYEWYMETFDCPFITDPKVNANNYAFKKVSPRFVLVSQKLKTPLSFYQFEGKDHFIVDIDRFTERFDEHIYRLYMYEMVIRLCNKGIFKHMTFYPDPVIDVVFKRDDTIPYTVITDEIRKEFASDENYITNTLHEQLIPESSVDPIVAEHGKIIDAMNEYKTNNKDINNG